MYLILGIILIILGDISKKLIQIKEQLDEMNKITDSKNLEHFKMIKSFCTSSSITADEFIDDVIKNWNN